MLTGCSKNFRTGWVLRSHWICSQSSFLCNLNQVKMEVMIHVEKDRPGMQFSSFLHKTFIEHLVWSVVVEMNRTEPLNLGNLGPSRRPNIWTHNYHTTKLSWRWQLQNTLENSKEQSVLPSCAVLLRKRDLQPYFWWRNCSFDRKFLSWLFSSDLVGAE